LDHGGIGDIMTKRKNTLNPKVSIDGTDEVALISSKSYRSWISELKKRYRATQIKAAIAVNSALLEFYWNLGKDISEK
jgi:hypothetical protein